MPTIPDEVTATSFANKRGADGGDEFKIETSFEKVVLNPKAFLDYTLNLK
jgi:hypothetical protein